MCFPRAEAQNECGESKVFVCRHGTVVPCLIVKLGATFWIAIISNGGDNSVENSVLLKIEILVEDMMSNLTEGLSFDGVGGCIPSGDSGRVRNVNFGRLWGAKFHGFDGGRGMFFGGISRVCDVHELSKGG